MSRIQMLPQPTQYHALTNHYTGLTNRIITKAHVTEAFDPGIDPSAFPGALETDALWDTGATNSVITPKVIKALGLKPVGKTEVRHGGGMTEEETYLVNLRLPNGVAFAGVLMTEMKKVIDDFGIIIGMNIIAAGDFSITNFNGNTCFSFRFPSKNTVDYVKEIQDQVLKMARPNDICPVCTSGRQFKKCHGARAR